MSAVDLAVPARRKSVKSVEWPTVALAVVIYAGWLALTYWHAALPFWLLVPLGAWVCAWHTSLQHEVIHGHPTANRRLNRLFAIWPLMLWLPYESYRISHLVHHRDERLTDPLDDPESSYWTEQDWGRFGWARRLMIRANGTLVGRIAIGPAWVMGRFLALEMLHLVRGERAARRIWLIHGLYAVPVLAWLVFVCDMPPLLYFLAFVYPGTALILVRSLAEHRAAEAVDERTAIVENAPVLGLLYLYNNLHAVHHEEPMIPWYEIPAWYRRHRERLIAENGGLVYNGYLDVARRFLFVPHDGPVHPFRRAA